MYTVATRRAAASDLTSGVVSGAGIADGDGRIAVSRACCCHLSVIAFKPLSWDIDNCDLIFLVHFYEDCALHICEQYVSLVVFECSLNGFGFVTCINIISVY